MKKLVSTLTCLICLGVWPASAPAQTPAAGATKVGVINIQQAIGSTEEGKKAFADLQKKYAPRQQELQRLQQDIQGIQEQLQKQGATLSDEEQRRLNRDLEEKQKQLKRTTEDANADFQADRDDAVRRIGQKMVALIGNYAEKNGYSLIVDDAQIPVYYASKEIDLTEIMVKQYDAAHPVTADAATPAAKPAATAKAGDKPKG
jgi:outer membrane protein